MAVQSILPELKLCAVVVAMCTAAVVMTADAKDAVLQAHKTSKHAHVASSSTYSNSKLPKLLASNPLSFHVKRLEHKWLVNTGYGYSGFRFTSTNGPNLNHYSGSNNLFNVSAWRLFDSLFMLGLSYQRSQLSMQSTMQLDATNSSSKSLLNGNELGVTVRKLWMAKFYLEGFVKYGFNTNKLNESLDASGVTTQGAVQFDGNFWLTGLGTGVSYPVYSSLLVNGFATLFYVNTNQNGYQINYNNGTSSYHQNYVVNSLNATENIGLTYVLNEYFRPFANFGLIEVLAQGANRSISDSLTPLTTQLPNLALDHFGYTLSSGLEVTVKKTMFLIGYSYIKRGTDYYSNNAYGSLSVPI